MADRIDVLKAAIARNEQYLVNKGASAIYQRLEAQKAELAFLLAQQALPVAVDPNFFVDGEGSAIIANGGSPNNPNGVTFTFADAVAWWRHVFEDGLNISKVRPSLTPGSKVLSADGQAAAEKLGKESDLFAPEDYNPLGLPVIP